MKASFSICLLVSAQVFAIVPTTDMYEMGQDAATSSGYAAQIPSYLLRTGHNSDYGNIHCS